MVKRAVEISPFLTKEESGLHKEDFDRVRWMPFIITGVILIAVYMAFNNLAGISLEISRFFRVISPLLYGILFTYFLYVPQRTVEKLLKKVKIKNFTFISERARGISTIIILMLLLTVIVLVSAFMVPIIASSITDLVNSLPVYMRQIIRYFNSLPEDSIIASLNIVNVVQTNLGSIVEAIMGSQGIEQAARGVISFAGGVFNVIIGLFLTIYILLTRDKIIEYFSRLNRNVFSKNSKRRDRVVKYFSQINKVLLTFIASKSIDSIINFTVATLILTIARMPYALLLGLVAGILNFIPFIGSIISAAIISLLAFLTCSTPTAVAITISIFAFQQLDGNFIEPRIMKTSFKISPILVIMAVTAGGAYFGVVGMFLGVPVAVIINQLLEEYMAAKEAMLEGDDSRR